MPITELGWQLNLQRCIDYFNNKPYLYVLDGYLGWDPKYRLKIRVICARAYHALFMHNMLIRPTREQLKEDFNQLDFTIFNAGEFYADPHTPGVDSQTTVNLNLGTKQMAILGT